MCFRFDPFFWCLNLFHSLFNASSYIILFYWETLYWFNKAMMLSTCISYLLLFLNELDWSLTYLESHLLKLLTLSLDVLIYWVIHCHHLFMLTNHYLLPRSYGGLQLDCMGLVLSFKDSHLSFTDSQRLFPSPQLWGLRLYEAKLLQPLFVLLNGHRPSFITYWLLCESCLTFLSQGLKHGHPLLKLLHKVLSHRIWVSGLCELLQLPVQRGQWIPFTLVAPRPFMLVKWTHACFLMMLSWCFNTCCCTTGAAFTWLEEQCGQSKVNVFYWSLQV